MIDILASLVISGVAKLVKQRDTKKVVEKTGDLPVEKMVNKGFLPPKYTPFAVIGAALLLALAGQVQEGITILQTLEQTGSIAGLSFLVHTVLKNGGKILKK